MLSHVLQTQKLCLDLPYKLDVLKDPNGNKNSSTTKIFVSHWNSGKMYN